MQRRQVLRSGVALSLPALAGCNRDPGTPSTTDAPSAPPRRWRAVVETPPAGAPVVAGETVVYVTDVPGDEPYPSRGGYTALLGYGAGGGAPRWSFEADDDGAESWQHRDTVLASWDSDTVALAPDGTDRWRKGYSSNRALFGHDNAYFAAEEGVWAVDVVHGNNWWRVPGRWNLSPVAADDDTLYLRGTADAADVRFGLHAVSPDDGAILWTTAVGPRQNDPVLHAAGTLVVGGDPDPTVQQAGETHPERPTIEGVAADSGTVRWRFIPKADFAAPRRAGGDVVLVKSWTFEKPNGPPDADSSTLYALDRADGTERWRVEGTTTRTPLGGERFESASVATEVVGRGAVYVRTASGAVTARELADGSERWRFDPHRAVPESGPAVGDHQPDLAFDGGDLLVTYADRLAALDPATGRRQWEYAAGEPLTQFFTVAEDAVVLTTETSLQVVDRD